MQAQPTISRAKADSLEREVVMWNNRPVPIGVVAHDFLQKVYGKSSYKGLTPTQVIISWTLAPAPWNEEPVIKEKRGRFHKMNDFIDYNEPTPTLKGMGMNEKLDEKVALVLMLQQGTLVSTPGDDVPPMSETRITLELLNARTPWSLIGVGLCILIIALGLIERKANASAFVKYSTFIAKICLTTLLVSHFALRWYLSGHIPLSTTYETLHFAALCLVLFSLVVRSSSSIVHCTALVVLFVSWLVERNPQITPLMPVLHSPWLSAHVSTIMLAYTLLVMSFFQRRLLRWAVGLLAIGIWLGAVWANVSWGAYWTWDPKESWALVTLIVYSIPLHTESLPWFRSTRHYRLYSLLALATLLMTYFGVNYLLGGMHSYG